MNETIIGGRAKIGEHDILISDVIDASTAIIPELRLPVKNNDLIAPYFVYIKVDGLYIFPNIDCGEIGIGAETDANEYRKTLMTSLHDTGKYGSMPDLRYARGVVLRSYDSASPTGRMEFDSVWDNIVDAYDNIKRRFSDYSTSVCKQSLSFGVNGHNALYVHISYGGYFDLIAAAAGDHNYYRL